MKVLKFFAILFSLFILLIGCESAEEAGFAALNDSNEGLENLEEVMILSTVPSELSLSVLSTGTKSFAVQVNSGAGEVIYTYELDGVEVSNSILPLYQLDMTTITGGSHTLKVKAENSISSDSIIFDIYKNSPPKISLVSMTAQAIDCVSGSFQLNTISTDLDVDALSFKFYLNQVENNTYLSNSSGLSSASTTFTPNCSLSGNNTISIRAYDETGEFSEYSTTVSVTNPNVASIDSYSPIADPVVILSTDDENFAISASGNPPLNYTWDISPGSSIASCAGLGTCQISGGDFSPGSYSLTSTVTDSLGTSANHTFNVVLNQKPQLTTVTPSNSETIKMNCASNKNFELDISDGNWSDGQSFTVTWSLDGGTDSSLNATDNFAIYPMTSDATFSPNCDSSLIGAHKIKAVVNDGYESQEIEWDVEVNYFSDECNNLDAGEICTLVGRLGSGSGLLNTDDDLRIEPNHIEPYPGGGYFFSSMNMHGVWFYNDTNAEITVLGKAVAAKTLTRLFGQDTHGSGVDGSKYTSYYFNSPRGMAYSSYDNSLYVADYYNNKVVKFDSSGTGNKFAGNWNGGNTDGATRTSHRCRRPHNIVVDDSEKKVFVACSEVSSGNDGTIKYFMMDSNEGYTLVRYGGSYVEGAVGYGNPARTRKAYSLIKDPTRKILYSGDLNSCRINAISYGGTATYYGGAISLAANELVNLTRGSCGESFNRVYSSSSGKIRPYALAPYYTSGELKGLFFSQYNRHAVGILNLSTTDITLGGRTVAAGYQNLIFGKNNTADYSRGEPAYLSTLLRNPFGLYVNGSNLMVADRGNGKIATLDLSTSNGNSDDFLGHKLVRDYDDETPKQANKRFLYNPRSMEYDATQNEMIFMDQGNRRIRSLDLVTGNLATIVGRGSWGNADSQTEDPNNVYFRYVYDLFVTEDGAGLFYTDYTGNTGTNRNCQGRVFNRSTSDQNWFNLTVTAGMVFDFAGNYVLGCKNWDGTYEGSDAMTSAMRYPSGIYVNEDASMSYIAQRDNHCILGVDSTGKIRETIGKCGSSGDVSSDFANTLLTAPGDLEKDENSSVSGSSNFFVVDRWITTNSSIKYVNNGSSAVTFFGSITVNPGEVGKILTTDGYTGSVANFEDQICYTQGANANGSHYTHNVICVNRGTGLTTLRVGKSSASVTKASVPDYDEEEGVLASSASLSSPWGLAFDADGNLYITTNSSHHIRMVKRWF